MIGFNLFGIMRLWTYWYAVSIFFVILCFLFIILLINKAKTFHVINIKFRISKLFSALAIIWLSAMILGVPWQILGLMVSKHNVESYELANLIKHAVGIPYNISELDTISEVTSKREIDNAFWNQKVTSCNFSKEEKECADHYFISLAELVKPHEAGSQADPYISVYFDEKILEYPPLFKAILNVLKKPCKYIPQEKEVTDNFKRKGLEFGSYYKNYLQYINTNLACSNLVLPKKSHIMLILGNENNYEQNLKFLIKRED